MAFHPFHRRRQQGAGDAPAGRSELLGLPQGTLADEAEAFVAGRLADHYAETGHSIPIWALLNRLAHGTVDELAELLTDAAHRGWRAHPSAAKWIVHERALAMRLIEAAPTGPALRRIQSELLVPVEMDLIERHRVRPVNPDVVADLATRVLDDHLLGR